MQHVRRVRGAGSVARARGDVRAKLRKCEGRGLRVSWRGCLSEVSRVGGLLSGSHRVSGKVLRADGRAALSGVESFRP